MTTSIKTSADGTQAIIQVNGVDKVVVGSTGIEAGSYKAGSITPTELSLAASSLGVGQTWQNLTGSRALGTTYTNSTGKPIFVSINLQQAGSGGPTLTISSVTAAVTYVSGYTNGYMCGIVPNGAAYSVNAGAWSIGYWSELR